MATSPTVAYQPLAASDLVVVVWGVVQLMCGASCVQDLSHSVLWQRLFAPGKFGIAVFVRQEIPGETKHALPSRPRDVERAALRRQKERPHKSKPADTDRRRNLWFLSERKVTNGCIIPTKSYKKARFM